MRWRSRRRRNDKYNKSGRHRPHLLHKNYYFHPTPSINLLPHSPLPPPDASLPLPTTPTTFSGSHGLTQTSLHHLTTSSYVTYLTKVPRTLFFPPTTPEVGYRRVRNRPPSPTNACRCEPSLHFPAAMIGGTTPGHPSPPATSDAVERRRPRPIPRSRYRGIGGGGAGRCGTRSPPSSISRR